MFGFTVSVLFSSITIMALANPAYAQSPSSDLAITMTSSPNTPVVGSLTYTVDVTNAGPDPANNVIITDTLPTGVAFDPVNSDGSCFEASGIVTCNLGVFNSVDDSGPILLVVTVGSSTGLPNTVTVASDSTDPNTTNNSATVGTAPPSGPQTLQDLIGLVQSFHLKKGLTHELLAPLNDAIKDLAKKHHHHEKSTPCNELNQFIKKVNSKEMRGKLTTDQASQLIQGATTIKSKYSCS